MKVYLFFLCIVMISCKNLSKNNNEIIYCSAELYNDIFIVGKSIDSLVYVKNLYTSEEKTFIANTENCFTPILYQNLLFYLKTDSIFECVDIQSNSKKWSYDASDKIVNFKLFADYIILHIKNVGICFLDIKNGNVFKMLDINKATDCNDLISDFILNSDELIITDFNCNNLSCYSIKKDEILWKVNEPSMYSTRFLLSGNYVFGGMTGSPTEKKGKIILIDKSNGKIIYEKDEMFDLIIKPILKDNKVYYVTYDEKIKVFDIENKTIKELMNLKKINSICDNQIFLVDESLYFSNCDFDVYEYNFKNNDLRILKNNNDYRLKNVFKLNGSIKLVF